MTSAMAVKAGVALAMLALMKKKFLVYDYVYPMACICVEPDFVSSYEIGDYIYFFFRETAIEYINCGKVPAVFSIPKIGAE